MPNSTTATAFWITDKQRGEIRSAELPELLRDQVRIQTLYSGVSLGTEALVFNHAVPSSEFQRMRAPFQEGEFPSPVKYGYINVGKVLEGPHDLCGQNVFCLYPHQTHYIVPSDSVTLIPLDVPAERAILAANLETAINALWDASAHIGDKISIVGAGVIGCLVGWLANSIPGCDVELIDINPERASVCDALGLTFSLPHQARGQRDLLIHTSATQEGLNTALQLAGFEATILELSWYGDKPVSVELGGSFHSRRLQLRSSQVGQIATAQRSRWDYKRRLKLALSLLNDERLDNLITGESSFSELPSTFQYLMKNGRDSLCHRIKYDV
ncbi:MAG: zinc-binding alcohol dehydrogenase [Granulosicoccus sp.]